MRIPKLLPLLVAGALALGTAACGNSNEPIEEDGVDISVDIPDCDAEDRATTRRRLAQGKPGERDCGRMVNGKWQWHNQRNAPKTATQPAIVGRTPAPPRTGNNVPPVKTNTQKPTVKTGGGTGSKATGGGATTRRSN